MKQSDIVKAIAVTNKVLGGPEIDKDVMRVFLGQLKGYDSEDVLKALSRCQREVKGKLALKDILDRIPSSWPTADEAWALCPLSEDDTVVWFDECAYAYGEIEGLEYDRVAMRMAFKPAYQRRIDESKAYGCVPRWRISRGTGPATDAEPAIVKAVSMGRIEAGDARVACPEIQLPGEARREPWALPEEAKRLGDGPTKDESEAP